MTSTRIKYGRRERMLELAEEAKSILSSETDLVDHHIWLSKTMFLDNNPYFSHDQPWRDDETMVDLMALFVLDDFPAEVRRAEKFNVRAQELKLIIYKTLNDILRANSEVTDEPYLWLADTYDTLPDYDPSNPPEGTASTVDSAWRSPFIGSSLQDIAAFIEAAPKPPKPLCKEYFAVLEKKRYEQDKKLLIYKILETSTDHQSETTLQSVPCPIHLAGHFFISFYRSHWEYAVRDQSFYYGDGKPWNNYNPLDQVMALFVLDEMPKATINKILDDNLELSGEAHLWLADSYDNLPDYRPNYEIHGNESPVDPDWQSPFVGKSVAEAANFVRNAPKPPKPLCKELFAVLQKDRFQQTGKLLFCKILPVGGQVNMTANEIFGAEGYRKDGRSLMCRIARGEGQNDNEDNGEFEVQMVEMKADHVADFFSLFERHTWWQFGESGYH